MKKIQQLKYIKLLSFIVFTISFSACKNQTEKMQEFRFEVQPVRPGDWIQVKYKYSIEQLRDQYSERMMQRANTDLKVLRDVNEKGPWKPTWESLNPRPIPDWIDDLKFGLFIDWGPWSVAGYATRKGTHYYPDWYEFEMIKDSAVIEYHNQFWGKDFRPDDLFSLLSGQDFDAEKYVKLAKDCGAGYFIPFTRHHGGWTLWGSKYTFRNAVEMGPHRDIYKEIADACRLYGIKLGLYHSVAEWTYPVIMPDGSLGVCEWGINKPGFDSEKMNCTCSGKIPVRDYVTDYFLPLSKEVIDEYDPDILWLDGAWAQKAEHWHSLELAAYFFNQAEGRKPVVINDRLGDKTRRITEFALWTSEFLEILDPTAHKWEENRSMSPSYGYHWQDNEENTISSAKLVNLLVKTVANNGNLLLILNPTGSGRLPEIQEQRLRDLGAWLKVNGEGIYSTRPWIRASDGDIYYTRSKDGQFVYIICLTWPGTELSVKDISPLTGSKITMLGRKGRFKWIKTGPDMNITIPAVLQDENKRPCDYGWVFKVRIK